LRALASHCYRRISQIIEANIKRFLIAGISFIAIQSSVCFANVELIFDDLGSSASTSELSDSARAQQLKRSCESRFGDLNYVETRDPRWDEVTDSCVSGGTIKCIDWLRKQKDIKEVWLEDSVVRVIYTNNSTEAIKVAIQRSKR
jgi:hypothetical protein